MFIHSLIPRVTARGTRDLAAVIRFLRWEVALVGGGRGPRSSQEGGLKGRSQRHGAVGLEHGGRGREPRNTSDPETLGETRKQILPSSLEKDRSL